MIPAFVARVRALRDGRAADIPVGNLDVRRDLTDVRDVARAYRFLLEAIATGRLDTLLVVNVASGHSAAIRDVLETMCRIAGVEATVRVDPGLVRLGEPTDVVGNPGRLVTLTGWRPEIPLERTLADVFAETHDPAAGAEEGEGLVRVGAPDRDGMTSGPCRGTGR